MDSFKSKVLKGAFWNSVTQAGSQGINFVVTIVLARLLGPDDFGLLGMATVITGFAGFFSEPGLLASLIRKQNIDDLDKSTTFWINICFSFIVFISLFFLAPTIAWFYDRSELTNIVRTIALVFPIGALSSLPIVLETKELRYDRITKIRLVSLLIAGSSSIFFAFSGFGVWSLIYQLLTLKTAELTGFVFFTKFKPKLMFSWACFLEHVSYGKHVIAHNLIKFTSENVDYLLVGKLLGAASLGVYTIAFRIAKYPIEKLMQIIGRILFPAFSTIQDNPDLIKKFYYEISGVGAIFTIPILTIVFFGTNEFVNITVGSKWSEAVPIIKIFIFYLIFMSMSLGDESIMVLYNIKLLNLAKLLSSVIFIIIAYIVLPIYGLLAIATAYTVVFSAYWIAIKIITNMELKLTFKAFKVHMKRVLFYMLAVNLSGLIAILLIPEGTDTFRLTSLSVVILFTAFGILYHYRAIKLTFPFLVVENIIR